MSSTSPAPSPSLPLLLYFIGVSASADSSFLLTFDEEKGKDSSSLGAEVKGKVAGRVARFSGFAYAVACLSAFV